MSTTSNYIEEFLENLASTLQVPPEYHKAAIEHYESVGEWLHRPESSVSDRDPDVYVQGSFRLGTAIRPIFNNEYDIDLVCELAFSKNELTQEHLKQLIGEEMKAYADANGLHSPEEGRRCWTLNYQIKAPFHIDILPALEHTEQQSLLLEKRGVVNEWTDTAIAITDDEHESYKDLSDNWPHSNPEGYANWFHSRMEVVFNECHFILAEEASAGIEEIPEYKVRTPLQKSIQILKCHRDIMFKNRPDDKPISIIITTLAAHAYQNERSILQALCRILNDLENNICDRNGVAWIANPTDPGENFADRWKDCRKRKIAFHEWLERVRCDFRAILRSTDYNGVAAALQPAFGKQLIQESLARRSNLSYGALTNNVRRSGIMLNPSHKEPLPWNENIQGEVHIERGFAYRDGRDTIKFRHNSRPLPKNRSLVFEAHTNIQGSFEVFWQVVNTGKEAANADGLRGGIEPGHIDGGKILKEESTLYKGKHSIECFIVKNGFLVAYSPQFIVNIK